MNKIIALAILASFQLHAEQSDTWINVHLGSNHLDLDTFTQDNVAREFNEQNLGLGISHEFVEHWDVRAGFFENSYYKTSVYLAVSPHTSYQKPIAVALQAGIATGYGGTPIGDGDLVPFIMPTISVNIKSFRGELGYIPRVNNDTSSALTFTVGYKF